VVGLDAAAPTTGLILDTPLPYFAANTAVAGITFASPLNYDVPDPAMGVRFDLSNEQTSTALTATDAFLPLGYATAVSSKDLSYCIFPVQSCLTSMTATLNDCTVTTNGDTLHEQILLTMTKENVKQRTTPSNYDSYAWGHDDANNGSGNFSSYSVVNSVGDVPNGAYPTVWYADAAGTAPLSSISTVQASPTTTTVTTNAVATYPHLPVGTRRAFNVGGTVSNTITSGSAIAGGVGWYIAAPTSSSVVGSTSVNGGTVVVPFVDNQPVWTTGFPGGDLLCRTNGGLAAGAGTGASPGFDITAIGGLDVMTLLKTVPPFSLIAARFYVSAGAIAGSPVTAVGFVAGLMTGALGQIGSTYSVVTGINLIGAKATLALQGGFQVTTAAMPVFGAVSVVEPLVVSPLIWSDAAEFQTVGLYGMTNMQVVMNFTSKLGTAAAVKNGVVSSDKALAAESFWSEDLSLLTQNTGNILRSSGIRTTISDLAFLNITGGPNGPWTNPALYVTFLTPGPDVTLPLVSTVPYVEMPRYVLQQSVAVGGIGQATLATNTISLTSIPDMIMLYVKPATKGPGQLDTYIPIKNVSISFDNFSNLCSGFQQFNLYECSVAAGLDVDYHQFRGYTAASTNSYSRVEAQTVNQVAYPISYKAQPVTQLSGTPLLLRMGHDITLSPGLAPGCLGNYSIQVNMQVDNTYGFFDYITSCTITLIAINTGFFETVRGQSAIRKTVLNSADVEAAIPEAGVSRSQLTRMVGRGAYGHGMSSFVTGALGQAGALAKDYAKREGMAYARKGVHRLVDMGMDEGTKRMGGSGLR